MDNFFKNFYSTLYLKTNGFIASKPLNKNMYPGDFFQIKNGEIIVLGNIYFHNIINKENAKLKYNIKQNPASWSFSDGVSKPHSLIDNEQNGIEGDFKYLKQILAFDKLGSFFFNSNNVESIKISNWSEIKNELIIKLTQVLFSFRELYIVSESALPSDWILAISGSGNAELELTSESENFELRNLFGEASTKTIRAKNIEFHHRETKKKPTFFKAKKLVVQQDKPAVFISELGQNKTTKKEWIDKLFNFEAAHLDDYSTVSSEASVLDSLQANELNPNTALEYFEWSDANLDDIEKLLTTYGN